MDQNTTIFTVVGIAILAIMIIGMLVSQSRHKALEARNNQIRLLTLQQRRLQNLLRSLPDNYLSVELRDFLYQALLQNLRSHIELMAEKSPLLEEDYAKLAEERERMRHSPPSPIASHLTADQASVYRGLLKSLYQFIKRNYETGRMKKEDAEKMLKQVELKLTDTALDFFRLSAQDFRSQGKYRQTRNALQKALDTIEESPYAKQFKQDSMKIRAELNAVIDEWRASRESVSAKAAERLAGEMESLVDEQESWKKKQDYN